MPASWLLSMSLAMNGLSAFASMRASFMKRRRVTGFRAIRSFRIFIATSLPSAESTAR